MQIHVCCQFAVLLCWLLAPLSSEAQSKDKWGEWSEWSPCSRTCGVGVTYQERECLEKEKPEDYCKGSKRDYRTCNIQDCPEGSRDFRLEQCQAFNNRTLDGRTFSWVPYIPTHERCILNCMPKGENFFMQWADKVVDGTRCSLLDSYDICVDGACQNVGCDLILNSNAKEDKCRVCNGNGENCKTHKGVNTDDGDEYKEILVIPASATNINIQEMEPSPNFLALADSLRSYFFNGDYVITRPKKFNVAGTVFKYERSSFGQERISSLGPTSIPVHVEVLFLGGKKSGISYEFSVPTSVTKLPEPAQFSWRTTEFDKCSVSCAGGEKKRRVYCVRDDNKEEVTNSNCDQGKKPSHKQKCNTRPCPASWYNSSWSSCSATCARGKQVRRVHCQHVVEGGDNEMIPDEQCPGSKPIRMRVCQMQKSCPEWSVGQWSKCSVSCGLGSKHRNITCLMRDTKKIYQPENCNAAFKPKDVEQCNPGPCTVTWMASNWSECYPKCGKGMSTRMIYCVSISNKKQKYPDDLCDVSSRPISEKNCSSNVLCPPMWHASQWSKCTATCGVGMQMRNVLCAKREGPKMLMILPNDQCIKKEKINGVQKCSVRPCQAGWYIYPWEPCSKTCGQSVRRRVVKCFADSKEDPEGKWCKAEDKPDSEEQCFQEECKVPPTVVTAPTQATTAVTTKQSSLAATTIPATTITTTTAEEATTTEAPEVTTTEAPEVTTTEAPEVTTTEAPKVTTTEAPVETSTKDPATTTQTSTTTSPSTTKSRTTTEAFTTTSPPPTTKRSTTTTPPPTTKSSTTTTPPPTTTPPSTTEASITTTPPPTTTAPSKIEASTITTPETTTAPRIQPATIIDPPKNILAYVGTEALFRCRAKGNPQPDVTWRKGLIPVASLDSSRMQILSDGDLRIANIIEEDNDVYTCTATNFVGPMDTKRARLTVIAPVSVSVSPKNATAQTGDAVTITCVARGTPRPIVEWYKDDQALSSRERVTVSRGAVVISAVETTDTGYYTCRAFHNYGTNSDKMYLNVFKKEETTEPPKKCEDDPSVADCPLVRRVNFCCINYYKEVCCKTCEDLLPSCNSY